MTINVERDFELVTLEVTGRLDTTTAPNLEAVINELSSDTKELVFDVAELEYISSAGIRVLLGLHFLIAHVGQVLLRVASDEYLIHFVNCSFVVLHT